MMKAIVLGFCILGLNSFIHSQISVFDCNSLNQVITQQTLNTSGSELYRPCVELGSPNLLQIYTPSKKITASTEIHVKPNVHIKPSNQSDEIWLKMNAKSDFDVAVMNYPDLDNVLKLKKFELGIELPEAVLQKVNNFINNVETTDKLNPFIEEDLLVEAFFTAKSSPCNISFIQNTNIVMHGYYSRAYETWVQNPILGDPDGNPSCWDPCYNTYGGYDLVEENPYPFRIRFAPPCNGSWQCVIKITNVKDNVVYNSSPFVFNVVQSDSKGYLRVGNNKRYLRQGSETFIPIAANIVWPETTSHFVESLANNELIENMYSGGYDDVPLTFTSEAYRSTTYCIPQVYTHHRDIMKKLNENGVNYMRFIMSAVSTEIEHEELGNYTNRLHMAQEMDNMLELAEERDFLIHWNMQLHYPFNLSDSAYGRQWTWDTEQFGKPFAYKTIEGVNDPMDFFTNPEAIKYYKQRLRYILSRWGYSTNIGVFELFSEITNVRPIHLSANYYYSNYAVFESWQKQMAEYIKSFHNGKNHLLTTNYADMKHQNDLTFQSEHFDIMTSNFYDFGVTDFGQFFIDTYSGEIFNYKNNDKFYMNGNTKPFISSEMDPIDAEHDAYQIERKRGLWQALFSGLAGGISWSAWYTESNYPVFKQMSQFMQGLDLDGENWHPGATKLRQDGYTAHWDYKKGYANKMGDLSCEADLSYLRSGDGNYAIGVITNKTFNTYNQDPTAYLSNLEIKKYYDIFNSTDDDNKYKNLKNPKIFITGNELKIKGMNTGKYYIEYFYPQNLNTPFHSDENNGPNVKIDLTLHPTQNQYIVLFKANRKNHSWMETAEYEFPEWENLPFQVADIEKNIDNNLAIFLQPNPSNDNTNLILSKVEENLSYLIYSFDGKLVESNKISNRETLLQTKKYSQGVYIIHVLKSNELIEVFKFLKH